MKTFEYTEFTVELDKKGLIISYKGKQLNYETYFEPLMAYLGGEGWELVSALPTTASEKPWLLELSMTYTGSIIYYFKRECTQETKAYYESLYRDQIDTLKSIDNRLREVYAREKAEEGVSNFSSLDELVNFYTRLGYHTTFKHQDRMIFALGAEEVRFDRNEETNRWNKVKK